MSGATGGDSRARLDPFASASVGNVSGEDSTGGYRVAVRTSYVADLGRDGVLSGIAQFDVAESGTGDFEVGIDHGRGALDAGLSWTIRDLEGSVPGPGELTAKVGLSS